VSGFELLETIPVGDRLGECVVWDDRMQCIWWTDIHGRRLHRYTPAGSALESFPLPERLGSFGFIEGDSRLICAFESGFAVYAVEREEIEWIDRPEQTWQGTRFNDGRVDRQGRFWAGTMVEGEARDGAGRPVKGGLYVLEAGRSRKLLGEIEISNSLCFSLDGRTLFFADSPVRQILAFEMQGSPLRLGASRIFASIDGSGVPDGSTIDAEDCLWNAEWGGGRLVRYRPDGTLDTELRLPVTQPTCVCFGGPALDWIIVSTATEGLDPGALQRQPEAGHLLIYRSPFTGVAENRFRL
jgi:L-arabinonolactonase